MPSTYRSTVIAAPVELVWGTVRDFHGLTWAPAVITECQSIGDRKGDQVGAGRLLNRAFRETLLTLDDGGRTMRYSLDDAPSPVSPEEVQDFVAEVRVRPVTDSGRTFVEWSASWQAADDAACEFASEIYAALLGELGRALSPGEG